MTNTAVSDQLPPPEMTGSAARVAHMRNWVEQLEADIARLQVERDTLWKAIAVLDPDGKVPFGPIELSPFASTGVSPAVTGTPSAATPKKRPAKTKAKSKPAATQSGSKHDYVKVAEIARAAHAAGLPMAKAVGEQFGTSPVMSSWLVTEARRRGLDVPSGRGQRTATVTQISTAPSSPNPAAPNPVAPKRNWPEIAGHIVEFRDAGVSVTDAIAKLYKVPTSTAKNWMTRCREQGLGKPLVANLKVIEDNTIDDQSTAVYNASEVAGFYLEAIRTNRRPIQFVADSFGIDKAQAVSWVRQARLDGELPATSFEPQLPEPERRAILETQKPEPVA